MANKFQPKQIYIDTVILEAAAVNEPLYKGTMIQWNLTGGAAGNTAVVKAKDGTLIYSGLASIANYVDRMVLSRDFLDGFYVPTLSAGGVILITRPSGRVQ